MGFFRKLLARNDDMQPMAVSEPPSPTRPAAIGYDPGLIASLQADHARLAALFERIGKHDKAGEYAQVCTLLAHFKSSLQAHILTENVRFYSYLENSLSDDAEDARTMHDFRRDMNIIARQVVDFVKTWQNSRFSTTAERQQFTSDYEKVGQLLEQRLDNEENSLYPLYQPS